MNLMARLLVPREVRTALDLLREAHDQSDCATFELVRSQIENAILSDPGKFAAFVRRGAPLREWVYSMIANVAGGEVESGRHHLYRGVLNPIGPGQDLLRIYDHAVDELIAMQAISREHAESQKAAIRENIKSVG